MSVSLGEASNQIGKSSRTLRRWCERGIIPWAYQTKGGHWRLARWTPAVRDRLAEQIKGFARMRNWAAFNAKWDADPGIQAIRSWWKRQSEKFPGPTRRIEQFNLACINSGGAMHAMASVLGSTMETLSEDLLRGRISDEQLQRLSESGFIDRVKEATSAKKDHALLAPVAQIMAAKGIGLNQRNLAHEMKISRTTLLKRYGASQVNDALATAAHYAVNQPAVELADDHALRRQNRGRNTLNLPLMPSSPSGARSRRSLAGR